MDDLNNISEMQDEIETDESYVIVEPGFVEEDMMILVNVSS